jgi:hypothetical protein
MSYTVVDRGTSHLKILLSGVSGGRYDVKVNNVTRSNVAHNATLTFTGLSPNVNYTVYVYKIPRLYGRVVIRNNASLDPLSLAEVEVFDFSDRNVSKKSTNLSDIKSVRQTTTAHGGSADRAIDGNTNGNYGSGSVTHTNGGATNYWVVEWHKPVSIKMVRIHNRTDCCGHRLDGALLMLDDVNNNTVYSKSLVDNVVQTYTFGP